MSNRSSKSWAREPNRTIHRRFALQAVEIDTMLGSRPGAAMRSLEKGVNTPATKAEVKALPTHIRFRNGGLVHEMTDAEAIDEQLGDFLDSRAEQIGQQADADFWSLVRAAQEGMELHTNSVPHYEAQRMGEDLYWNRLADWDSHLEHDHDFVPESWDDEVREQMDVEARRDLDFHDEAVEDHFKALDEMVREHPYGTDPVVL